MPDFNAFIATRCSPWMQRKLAMQNETRDAPEYRARFTPATVIIPSETTDRDFCRSDFFRILAFRGACRDAGVPLDMPIPVEAYRLAGEAFELKCRGDAGEGAAWRAVREALIKETVP